MVKKKKVKAPRRLGKVEPLMVRGTRIYYHHGVDQSYDRDAREHAVDAAEWEAGAAGWIRYMLKDLQRGEIVLFNGMMIRPSRRGRWSYQVADGIWTEVRFIEDIPIPWDQG